MSHNSGPFLVSSHGPPGFNPRLPTSTSSPILKRATNGSVSLGNSPNTSAGSNMNISSAATMMRTSSSMGTLKSTNINTSSMDKLNSMSFPARSSRKVWPMSRNMQDKNVRSYDDHESPYVRSGIPNHSIPSENSSGSSFTIEPAIDDDEGDDIKFSSRNMAAARFQRNQRLLYEIFSEVCIPDLRTNISVDRILTLRRQVVALKTHRETFEKDLHDLEERHVEKKRKFTEANEKFYKDYTDVSSKDLTQEKITEILQKYEAMEKLQKEKQLILQQQQQQQQAVATPPSVTVAQLTVAIPAKAEPVSIADVPQQQIPSPMEQTSLPPTQTVTAPVPSTQPISTSEPVSSHMPSSQFVRTQLPLAQAIPSHIPPSQPIQHQALPSQVMTNQIPSTQPMQTTMQTIQAMPSQITHSQSIPPHMVSSQAAAPPSTITSQSVQPPMAAPGVLPSSTSVMSQIPPPLQSQQQQTQPAATPQNYPMMHPVGGYASSQQQIAGYSHPQQTPYRSPINQRPTAYPSNVQWQQQSQQWQTNTYESRYYNPYPGNVQWSQQQPQQWPSSQPPQQIGSIPQQQVPPPHTRGPPHQQQAQMYPNGVHYSYGNAPTGWNSNVHPQQQYGYPQNPSYDPSMVPGQPPAPPQQQYYPAPQIHNASHGYDYGPPPQTQQQMPSQ